MNLNQFIKHVEDMRKAQERYYKTFQIEAQKQARKHEIFVDNLIKDYKKEQLEKMNTKLF